MSSQFDSITERRGTCCVKWDTVKSERADVLPMWIADMDFPAAPGIVERLHRRAGQGVFGYGLLSTEYYAAVIRWMDRRHHCKVEREWIVFTAGVVTALNFAVQAATEPGDEVLVPSPVYGPFYHAVEDWGRTLVKCPLKCDDLHYTFDFADMERRISKKTRALLLCSPHNPVGRVWIRAELEELADFCLRHNLIVIADEIHNDLVFRVHTMFLNISPEIAARTILCTAPSKTFNLAGIQASNVIIPDEGLRQSYRAIVARNHAFSANSFVEAAVVGAYQDCEGWLDELLAYLEGNITLFCETLDAEIPKLRVRRPEGTYMVWVDCSGLELDLEARKAFFKDTCGLLLNDGTGFGEEGRDFVRINLACPRTTVVECLCRLSEHCQ